MRRVFLSTFYKLGSVDDLLLKHVSMGERFFMCFADVGVDRDTLVTDTVRLRKIGLSRIPKEIVARRKAQKGHRQVQRESSAEKNCGC